MEMTLSSILTESVRLCFKTRKMMTRSPLRPAVTRAYDRISTTSPTFLTPTDDTSRRHFAIRGRTKTYSTDYMFGFVNRKLSFFRYVNGIRVLCIFRPISFSVFFHDCILERAMKVYIHSDLECFVLYLGPIH